MLYASPATLCYGICYNICYTVFYELYRFSPNGDDRDGEWWVVMTVVRVVSKLSCKKKEMNAINTAILCLVCYATLDAMLCYMLCYAIYYAM